VGYIPYECALCRYNCASLLLCRFCTVGIRRCSIQKVISASLFARFKPRLTRLILFRFRQCNMPFAVSSLLNFLLPSGSRGSSVGIATGYLPDDQGVGVRFPVESRIFTSPYRTDRLWGPPSLLSNAYRWVFPKG
jgi:hypothetical protein